MKTVFSKIVLLATKTIIIVLALFFYSCHSSSIFEENKEIPLTVWNKDSIIKFDVEITDLQMPANFYINVRNSEGFPYSNLFLFVKTIFPDGKISRDTLECILADEKGKWLGSGMGDIYDNQIPFKRNVRFPIKGKYTFEIQHGMRSENIPLIMDMGLRIQKAE